MRLSKHQFVALSLLVAFSGLCIYGAVLLSDYLRKQNRPATDVAKNLSLPSLLREDGSAFDISELSGRAVVVASWATWCPSCYRMITDLGEVQREHQDSLAVILVNRAEEQVIIDDFKRAYPLPSDLIFLSDRDDAYFETITGRAMPEMVFYSKEGVIVERRTDAPPKDVLRETLTRLIDTE